jgi:hypothetical protein
MCTTLRQLAAPPLLYQRRTKCTRYFLFNENGFIFGEFETLIYPDASRVQASDFNPGDVLSQYRLGHKTILRLSVVFFYLS